MSALRSTAAHPDYHCPATRDAAHSYLTRRAHQLRKPGQCLAEAFELARLLDDDAAKLLRLDLDDRAGRDLAPKGNRVSQDALAARVRAHVRGPDGKVSRDRLEAFAKANGLWVKRYVAISTSSLCASVLAKLKGVGNLDPVFPDAT